MINGKNLIPVWEDTYYETSAETLDFRIKLDGVKIYDGYAEAFPDGKPIRVYVNRIAGDYLYNGEFNPSQTGMQADSGASAVLTLTELRESGGTVTEGTVLGSITVFYGFKDAREGLISDPVNGRADARMFLPLSAFFTSGTTITIN